ncbi:MAG: phage terminase large subunit, partial [bacterium]
WPEHEDYYALMEQLVSLGRRAFFKEKQNDPRGAGARLFDLAKLALFRIQGEELVVSRDLKGISADGAQDERTVGLSSLRRYAFLDPALGAVSSDEEAESCDPAQDRSDYAAIAVAGAAPDGSVFILDVWLTRATPSMQVAALFDLHERWGLSVAGVETNAFQKLLLPFMEEERSRRREAGRRFDLALEAVVHHGSKRERIAALEPAAANGWIAFHEMLPERFWQQLEGFPVAAHDDGPDVVEAAFSLARRHASGVAQSLGRVSERVGRKVVEGF